MNGLKFCLWLAISLPVRISLGAQETLPSTSGPTESNINWSSLFATSSIVLCVFLIVAALLAQVWFLLQLSKLTKTVDCLVQLKVRDLEARGDACLKEA